MTTTARRGEPTPPIEISGGAERATAHLATTPVDVPGAVIRRLGEVCEVVTDAADVGEASRDWWPLAMTWATAGEIGQRATAIVRPASADDVAAVLRICSEARIPVTAAAGRSGVCGNSVPVFGGVVLDMTAMHGIRDVDDASLVVDVLPGMFGDVFEEELQSSHGLTVGHWPQSMALSTVGGWLACRGAGQMSNRYGKIEDIVVGLDVVLADGSLIHTGGNARQSVGPDLNQLFVGSEGTLGIIVGARLRAHPKPAHTRQSAFGLPDFDTGLEVCRRILRRGTAPAVLRLYDAIEGQRNFETGDVAPLLVYDEGDEAVIDTAMEIVAEETAGAHPLDKSIVDRWMEHRNDVSALEALISKGFVIDTMEITGPWAKLPDIYHATLDAIGAVDGILAVSAHQSHAYTDGACLYFTFGAAPGEDSTDAKDHVYRAAWDAGTRAVIERGGSLSHHHGVGVNRARFMRESMGGAFDVLVAMKQALDPGGILNPGKLGLPSSFGDVPFAEP